jgi:hypothetical protein
LPRTVWIQFFSLRAGGFVPNQTSIEPSALLAGPDVSLM